MLHTIAEQYRDGSNEYTDVALSNVDVSRRLKHK